jgi:hypothetical protein
MLSSLQARAEDSDSTSHVAGMRYVSVEVQSDNADNRDWRASASLTAGDYVWLRAGFGKSKSLLDTDTLDTNLASGGIGIRGEHLELKVDFTSRKDGDKYDQRDWNGSFGWRNDTFGIAVDGMARSTGTETVQIVTLPIIGPRSVLVKQSIDGSGFGVHADVNVTDELNLFAGGMSYSYDDVATNRPALVRLLNFSGSGITREQAILDRSWDAGFSYGFELLDLTAEYFNDKTLASGDITHTMLLSAAIFMGEHWMLTPTLGRSSNDALGDVTFGAVSLSYGW